SFDVPPGRLARLTLMPFRIRHFRLNRPSAGERTWLHGRLDRECRKFRHRVIATDDAFALEWA
ncbi:MAG: poly-gamma-glutamate biosynthesis protein, partial [Deltaproteobacteria bacterium]